VIDASALGAVLFVEPDAARVASRVDAGILAAPALLDVEFAGICLKKLRHHPELRQLLLRGLSTRPICDPARRGGSDRRRGSR
jgi:uncharacterized protein with PIN domain